MSERDYLTRILDDCSERTDEDSFRVDSSTLESLVDDLYRLLLIDYIDSGYTPQSAHTLAEKVETELLSILEGAKVENRDKALHDFLAELPETRRLILGSAQALMKGDPASDSLQEIVLCYPGFRAIALYRIANILYRQGLKVLARMISERAHRETGIDISPGATIGERFFIDHGTGIVIGETTVIGNDVKMYQGVTLGALSLRGGREKLRGVKRHPTIEDGVTIYSGCAIFGGETIVGRGSTLGALTVLTSSVPPRSLVLMTNPQTQVKSKDDG